MDEMECYLCKEFNAYTLRETDDGLQPVCDDCFNQGLP